MKIATIILYLIYALAALYAMTTSGQPAAVLISIIFVAGLIGIWLKNNLLSRAAVLFPLLYAVLAFSGSLPTIRYYTNSEIIGAIVLFSIPAIVNEVRILREPKIAMESPERGPVLETTPIASHEPRNPSSVENRLRKIESLKAKGVITEAEYQSRRERILDEV